MTGHLDPGRYEELVQYLLDLQQRDSSLDPIDASFQAITAVIGFLNTDNRLVEKEATRSLGRLQLALFDRLRGAKPKLLFDKPNRMGARGAPSYTSAAIRRTLVNCAFLSLCEAHMSQQEASEWVAAELKRATIRQPNGRPIDARTIVRWGTELGGKSPKGSDNAFRMYVLDSQSIFREVHSEAQANDTPLTQQQAKVAAAHFIKSLKIAGF